MQQESSSDSECDAPPVSATSVASPPVEQDWLSQVRPVMASSPIKSRRRKLRGNEQQRTSSEMTTSDSSDDEKSSGNEPSHCSADSCEDDQADSTSSELLSDNESLSSLEWPSGTDDDGDDNGDGPEHSDNDDTENINGSNRLRDDLAKWAAVHRVSHECITGLLSILRSHEIEGLPACARTLLKTPRKIVIQEQTGGQYYHFGLEASINYAIENSNVTLEEGTALDLQINIDGLPINNSNNDHLWPILGIVDYNAYRSGPFCIGLFFSKNSKAGVAQEFLHDFIEDYLHAHSVGVTVLGVNVIVNLSAVICDAPAMAFVKEIKLHSGYGACFKCEQRGVKAGGRMTFPKLLSRLRTDQRFRRKVDTEHHNPGVTSPFEDIEDLDMVDQFLYDYMHTVLLCVLKRIMKYWVYGPGDFKLDATGVNRMTARLLLYAKTCPTEFGRRPRSLANLRHFKATEFRSFLCYTGVATLLGIHENTDVYYNFLLLVCAMRILLNPVLSVRFHAFAKKLLVAFVKTYKQLYGERLTVFSVHAVIHLPRQAAQYGHLDRISSFPYESYLYTIKQLIRKPGCTLKQVVARMYEQRHLQVPVHRASSRCNKYMMEHNSGPLTPDWRLRAKKQYKGVIHSGVKYSTSRRDSAVMVSGRTVGVIQNLVQEDSGDVFAVLRLFRKHENQFTEPIPSQIVGIVRCSSLADNLSVRPLAVCKKVWLQPAKNDYYLAVEVNNDMTF